MVKAAFRRAQALGIAIKLKKGEVVGTGVFILGKMGEMNGKING